jgi:N-acetylglucosamine kinase-like BadF-type ATPase
MVVRVKFSNIRDPGPRARARDRERGRFFRHDRLHTAHFWAFIRLQRALSESERYEMMKGTGMGIKAGHYIGLDCGGTTTRGVLADEQMKVLARARAGPGNPLSAGMRVAVSSYRSVISRLLSKAGLDRADINALGIGAAGAGRPAERLRLEKALKKLVPRARILVESDGMIALLGATLGKAGIIVIAGTGSFVLGMDSRGKTLRGGGWGPLLGDEGGGATLGREAIQALLRAEDGRVPVTALRKAILNHFHVRTPGELVTRVYRRPPTPREYARIWPLLLREAEQGDRVARSILMKGGEELADTIEAVARRLRFTDRRIPLIFAGGVLSRDSLMRRTILRRLKQSVPRVVPVPAIAAPEIGALHLARGTFRAS